MGKVQPNSSTNEMAEKKWFFTLQLSNKLIEACYNLKYGQKCHLLDTIYDETTVFKDDEKVTIQLEDYINMVYSQTSPSKPSHTLLDIGFKGDSWCNGNADISPNFIVKNISYIKHERIDNENPQECENAQIEKKSSFSEETSNNAKGSGQTDSVLVNFSDEFCLNAVEMEPSFHNQERSEKTTNEMYLIENNSTVPKESSENVIEDSGLINSVLVSFSDDLHLNTVKLEPSFHKQERSENTGHGIKAKTKLLRPNRKPRKQLNYKDMSFGYSTGCGETNNEKFKAKSHPKRKSVSHHKSLKYRSKKADSVKDIEAIGLQKTDSDKNIEANGSQKTDSDKNIEANGSQKTDSDKNIEAETSANSVKQDLNENSKIFTKPKNRVESDKDKPKDNKVYVIKVECPFCKLKYKYCRGGIIRHIKGAHKDLKMMTQFRKNIVDWANIGEENIMCQLCNTEVGNTFYPLHLQWEHTHNKFEECQIALAEYFDSVKSIENLSSEEFMQKFGMSVATVDSTINIDTITCEHCSKLFGKRRIATHLKKCVKNPLRKALRNCPCGYKNSDVLKFRQHRKLCVIEPSICDICGKTLKTKSEFNSHMKFDHGIISKRGTAIKDFPCADCDRVFHLKCRLRVHRIRKHCDERNFVCEYCSKSYKLTHALKRHIDRAHKKIYRYYCDKCGHGMITKTQVMVHICGKTRKCLKHHERVLKKFESNNQQNQKDSSKPKTTRTNKKTNEEPMQSEIYQTASSSNTAAMYSEHYLIPSELHPTYTSASSDGFSDNANVSTLTNPQERVIAITLTNSQEESGIFQTGNLNTQAGSNYQHIFLNDPEILPSSAYDLDSAN